MQVYSDDVGFNSGSRGFHVEHLNANLKLNNIENSIMIAPKVYSPRLPVKLNKKLADINQDLSKELTYDFEESIEKDKEKHLHLPTVDEASPSENNRKRMIRIGNDLEPINETSTVLLYSTQRKT